MKIKYTKKDVVKKLTELLIGCNVTWSPKSVAYLLVEAGVTLDPKSKHCYQCKHYLGGGDWSLCCNLKHELCYKTTNACESFEDSKEK